jgi:NAD+ kinase
MSETPAFRTIGIYAKIAPDEAPEPILQLLSYLESKGVATRLEATAARQIQREDLGVDGDELPGQVDLVIVLGGDGTMLSVVRRVKSLDVPILGINFGTLGFLTEIPRDQMITKLERIFQGHFRIEERLKLEIRTQRSGAESTDVFFALNDAVITKGAFARIIELEAYVGDRFLTLLKADGLIIATPTGSTGYSLSAGGPIVAPTGRNLILSPICPHTLSQRPLVLDGTEPVRVRLIRGEDVQLTFDGQIGTRLAPGDEACVKPASHPTRLLLPEDQNFFQVLRQKLKWGGQ